MFDQEDKVVQMYETMMTRHSTMLVGPTGGGKTVVMNALIKAQTHMGLPTKCQVVNPKACSVVELYGCLDMQTRDWVDGLFSNIFREMNRPIERDVIHLRNDFELMAIIVLHFFYFRNDIMFVLMAMLMHCGLRI